MTTVRNSFFLLLIGLLFADNSNGQTYSSITSNQEIYDFLNWLAKNETNYKDRPPFSGKKISQHIIKWDTVNFIPTTPDSISNKYPKMVANDFFNTQYIFKSQDGIDTIFKPADRSFILQQFTSIKDTIWHSKFPNSKLLTNQKQKRPNRYYFSIPLFSINRNYVIVQREYYCGSLCAYGGIYIYKKITDKKWQRITAINTWVS